MSFDEFFQLFLGRPEQYARSVAQYLKDVFDYFGTTEIKTPRGTTTRWKLFDVPFDGGRDRLVGQEEVQARVYRVISNFVREGTVNKLVLLHGPNGSAKSTFVSCMVRALEYYSTLDEGALYRFNWILPVAEAAKGRARLRRRLPAGRAGQLRGARRHLRLPGRGHGRRQARRRAARQPAVAHPAQAPAADPRRQAARQGVHLLRLHPLRRPRAQEQADLRGAPGRLQGRLPEGAAPRAGRALLHRQALSPGRGHRRAAARGRRAGAPADDGPLARRAADRAAVGGALRVLGRARRRQPRAHRVLGPAQAPARGLQVPPRPPSSTPRSRCRTRSSSATSSSSARRTRSHLAVFKEVPEFQSFKGRLELIRVPYLLDYEEERKIYEEQIHDGAVGRHIAPHTAFVAALWATLDPHA